ncbi:nucleoside hydrolase, partial [Nitrospirillum viridazoti]
MTAVLIDCDPGIDDALALALAVASPELDVRAVTCVAGNRPVAVTAA